MVLLTIDIARKSLPNIWLTLGMFNMMAVGIFAGGLFRGMPVQHLLFLMGVACCTGLPIGVYLTFRSVEGTSAALFRIVHFVIFMELLMGGGGAALATLVAGRSDLNWLAFSTNAVVTVLSLLGGMYREANALDLFNPDKPNRWRAELERHIDYTTYQVQPSHAQGGANEGASRKMSPYWIVAIATTNIPLLFEIFGGGRNNAIFLAVPMFMVAVAIGNLKFSGHKAVRVILLRQLEKEHGRRFINADLEQIQELRRTFFLSRWLMKDYARPTPSEPARVVENEKPAPRKRKRK